jgi:8-oxo-dGTP pyrophosphatase MutT (NUDIX family)
VRHHEQKIAAALSLFKKQDWPALPGRTNHKKAGVIVPLLADEEWTCILTQRTAILREHGGEICFPGGKPDPQDISLQDTALREAKEELGLHTGTVLTRLSSIPLYTSDYRLEPFLTLFPAKTSITPNPNEVAHVLPLSIKCILSLPFIDGKDFTFDGKQYLSPIFLPKKLGFAIEQPIFGGTAHVLYETITLVARALSIDVPPTKCTFDQFPFRHPTN